MAGRERRVRYRIIATKAGDIVVAFVGDSTGACNLCSTLLVK